MTDAPTHADPMAALPLTVGTALPLTVGTSTSPDVILELTKMEATRRADLLRLENLATGIGETLQRFVVESREANASLATEIGLVKAQATATNGRVTGLEKVAQYAAGVHDATSRVWKWVVGIVGTTLAGGCITVLGLALTHAFGG